MGVSTDSRPAGQLPPAGRRPSADPRLIICRPSGWTCRRTSGPRSMNLSATRSLHCLSCASTTKPKAPRLRYRICGRDVHGWQESKWKMQASSEEECFLLRCSGTSWMRGCRGCATSWAVSTGWDAGFRRPSAAAGGSAFDPARHRRGCTFAAQPLAPRPLLHCAGFKVVWAGRGQGFTTSPARDGQPWSGGGQVPCRRPAPPRSPPRRVQPWLLHRPHSWPGVPGAGGPPGAARNPTLLRRARAAPSGSSRLYSRFGTADCPPGGCPARHPPQGSLPPRGRPAPFGVAPNGPSSCPVRRADDSSPSARCRSFGLSSLWGAGERSLWVMCVWHGQGE